jgi:hypothetical protein
VFTRESCLVVVGARPWGPLPRLQLDRLPSHDRNARAGARPSHKAGGDPKASIYPKDQGRQFPCLLNGPAAGFDLGAARGNVYAAVERPQK